MLGSTLQRIAAIDVVEGTPPSHAVLVGGHLALDFLNSRPTPLGARADWLRDGIGLAHWLEQADAIGEEEARRIREDLGVRAVIDEVAERARALREWLRDFVGRHAGRVIGEEVVAELHPLNDLLERGASYWQIELVGNAETMSTDNNPTCLRRVQRLTTPDQLLQPLGEAIADLVSNEDFRLIRACEGKACGRVFLDRTRLHGERGCGATLCGRCLRTAEVFVRTHRDSD